jgi:mannan endo-1,4-beta-mannosidase
MSIPSFAQPQGFDHYITAKGAYLMDGDKIFRFLSFNIPNLNYIEDELHFTATNPYGLPNEFEIRDAFESVRQMGGTVVRLYTIPVRNTALPVHAVTYVEGPGQFNEEAFKTLDLVLALAHEYQIRLIIPLVNNWQWMGGAPNYAAFRKKKRWQFWRNQQLKADFKLTIHYLLNRVNTITGVSYKNDKAILCWETGNELQAPASWTAEMAAYIKSIDTNHLLMDGYFAFNLIPIRKSSIRNPNIDLLTTHHYEKRGPKMLKHIKRKVKKIKKQKPVIIGELGFISTPEMKTVLDEIIEDENIAGALVWSLRYHHRDGGFYWHSEPAGRGIYKAYHWPGFKTGAPYDERAFLSMWRHQAFAIQELKTAAMAIPESPMLLPIYQAYEISWQGSAGASAYDVYRTTDLDKEWQRVGEGISDAAVPYQALFHDKSAEIGQTYFYRVVAMNESGQSEPSNIVGPVVFDRKAIVDQMVNVVQMYAHKGLKYDSGNDRAYKEQMHRMIGKRGAEAIYEVPGQFLGASIYTFEQNEQHQLQIMAGPKDNPGFEDLTINISSYPVAEKTYPYYIAKQYDCEAKANVEHLAIKFLGKASIVRVVLYYK